MWRGSSLPVACCQLALSDWTERCLVKKKMLDLGVKERGRKRKTFSNILEDPFSIDRKYFL